MTLNIAVTCRHAVYLTGDFRLTFPDGHTADNLNVQKLIPISKFDWFGLISFCGVARTSHGIELGDWIAEQTRPANVRESVHDVIGRLQNADRWLSRMAGDNRLCMTLVGFHQRRPMIKLLSNFQDLDGRSWTSHPRTLRLFETAPKRPEVRFFGDLGAVVRAGRDRLASELAQAVEKRSRHEMFKLLSEANAAVAAMTRSVSREFVAGALAATGDGEVAPHLENPEGYFPDFVKRALLAMDVTALLPKLDEAGRPFKPGFCRMSLRIEPYTDAVPGGTLVAFALSNVISVTSGPNVNKDPKRQAVFKIIEENEPERITWQVKGRDGLNHPISIEFPGGARNIKKK